MKKIQYISSADFKRACGGESKHQGEVEMGFGALF